MTRHVAAPDAEINRFLICVACCVVLVTLCAGPSVNVPSHTLRLSVHCLSHSLGGCTVCLRRTAGRGDISLRRAITSCSTYFTAPHVRRRPACVDDVRCTSRGAVRYLALRRRFRCECGFSGAHDHPSVSSGDNSSLQRQQRVMVAFQERFSSPMQFIIHCSTHKTRVGSRPPRSVRAAHTGAGGRSCTTGAHPDDR